MPLSLRDLQHLTTRTFRRLCPLTTKTAAKPAPNPRVVSRNARILLQLCVRCLAVAENRSCDAIENEEYISSSPSKTLLSYSDRHAAIREDENVAMAPTPRYARHDTTRIRREAKIRLLNCSASHTLHGCGPFVRWIGYLGLRSAAHALHGCGPFVGYLDFDATRIRRRTNL
jgi:hypothetical protein